MSSNGNFDQKNLSSAGIKSHLIRGSILFSIKNCLYLAKFNAIHKILELKTQKSINAIAANYHEVFYATENKIFKVFYEGESIKRDGIVLTLKWADDCLYDGGAYETINMRSANNSEKIIGRFSGTTTGIEFFRGKLYNATKYKVYETGTRKVVATRNNHIFGLGQDLNNLLDFTPYAVYNTFDGKIRLKQEGILGLGNLEHTVIRCGESNQITSLDGNAKYVSAHFPISAVCKINDKLGSYLLEYKAKK